MKKIGLLVMFLTLPALSQAMVSRQGINAKPIISGVPSWLSPATVSEDFEWGCPIASEFINARTPSEAIEIITHECKEQVKKAALLKPGVFEVIKTDVIYPDVNIAKEEGGFRMTGTFFLSTKVLLSKEEAQE